MDARQPGRDNAAAERRLDSEIVSAVAGSRVRVRTLESCTPWQQASLAIEFICTDLRENAATAGTAVSERRLGRLSTVLRRGIAAMPGDDEGMRGGQWKRLSVSEGQPSTELAVALLAAGVPARLLSPDLSVSINTTFGRVYGSHRGLPGYDLSGRPGFADALRVDPASAPRSVSWGAPPQSSDGPVNRSL